MAKIRIQNFGPIQTNNSWIEIDKITLFVGSQGSGKSSIAKLISTFLWIEKALNRGDHTIKHFERKSRFKNTYLTYHRIQNYLKPDSLIEFWGDSYYFCYQNGALHIEPSKQNNELTQIMYVPAERNFLTHIETFKELKVSSPSLREFRDEYKIAQKNIKGKYELPIGGTYLEYDRQNDILHLRGDDYKLRISETSSGYQSLVPLYIVSLNLALSVLDSSNQSPMKEEDRERFQRMITDILFNPKFSDQQRRDAMNALSDKFTKTAFINIVEEPEQNLYPSSQWNILTSLLRINNMSKNNQLIMTSHSPYIVNFLTLIAKAYQVKNTIQNNEKLLSRINTIIPLESLFNPSTLNLYEIKNGKVKRLRTYAGLLSDDNQLNSFLGNVNNQFNDLLDIEEEYIFSRKG